VASVTRLGATVRSCANVHSEATGRTGADVRPGPVHPGYTYAPTGGAR